MEVLTKSDIKMKLLITHSLILLLHLKIILLNLEIFLSLGNLAENIYNGNVSLDAAKQEQRRTENMLENFISYNPVTSVYKNQRVNILSNAKEFYKGRKEILIAFGENMFPLPKPYVFGKNEWKERDLGNKKFIPETLKKRFLEKYDQILLSEKKTNF